MPYLKPYWHLLVIGGVFALVVAATEGMTAWLVKPAMDDIFLKRDVLMLKLLPLALLGVYLLKGGGRFGQSYLMASVGERVIARIRRELYAHIQGMPLAFFASLHSADLMSRVVTDVNRLARLSSTVLVMAVRQAGTIVALLVVMFSREWVLTLIAVAIFPLAGVTIRAIGKKLYRINKRSQQKIAELNVVLQESFTGTKIVKAFGREALEQQRFNDVNDRLMRLALKDHRTDQLAEPLMEVMGALGLMGALWYGGYQVISGRADPGGVLLLHRGGAPALRPRAPALAHGQYRAAVARLRRARVSDPRHAPGHRGRAGARSRSPAFATASSSSTCRSAIRRCRSRRCATSRSTMRKGELVAFVGMSGAGKTTLMDLLPRFHDVTSGRITIDGHDVREVTVASLRGLMGIVTQETLLFHDTSSTTSPTAGRGHARRDRARVPPGPGPRLHRGAPRWLRDPGRRARRPALRRPAAAARHRPRLPEGSAHPHPGRGHVRPRRGERVPRPAGAVRADEGPHGPRHRPPAGHRENADRVVVVHGGRIAEMGTHDELMAREDGIYRRLATLQALDLSASL